MITFTTRRATTCHGIYDKMVLHVALYDGREISSDRYLPDLVKLMRELAERGGVRRGIEIPAGTVVCAE